MNYIRFLFLTIIFTFSYSKTIIIDDNKGHYEILSKSQIHIDHSKNLSVNDILANKVEFKDNDKKVLGFGYSPNFNVWIKISLENVTNKRIEKLIEYDNSITTSVDFFDPKNKNLINEGSFHTKQYRKTLNPVFKINLDAYEKRVYYVKASSYITTLILKLNLWDIDKFYEKELEHQVILALFFGALIVLSLYNLFIYFITKNISYLYYVFYVLGIVFHHLMYVGFANIYLFSNDSMVTVTIYAVLLATFPILSLALFTKYFLSLEQYKVINKILNIFLILVSISIIFFIFTTHFNNYRNLLPLILFIYLFIVTVYAAYKKNSQAYFLLFGWSTIILAIVFMYLSSRGIFNVYEYYPYVIETAFISEAVIFSIALAYRIRQLQKEKNKINKKLIDQQKEEGKRLKVQVDEKTKDLKDALNEKGLLLRELHHRVKNNMQMITSLMELQADDIGDKRIQEIFKTVQNRIYAMKQIHELLYREEVNITKIDAYEYFDRIIDELGQSYNTENVEINLDTQTQVKVTQAIYCGLILNELVTNSIKYGFKNAKGKIKVVLKMQDDKYLFHIEDNGIGYTRSQESDSLGLLLVDTLVKKQLKGKLKIDANDGVKVDIIWSKND